MAIYRGTMLFEFLQAPVCGFSESFAFTAVDDDDAKNAIATWPAKRKTFLSQRWTIVGFRLAKVESFLPMVTPPKVAACKFKFTPVTVQACPAPVAGDLGEADNPYTTVLIDFFRDDKKHPRAYMARGIPDSWWSNSHISIPPAEQGNFDLWFLNMKNLYHFGAIDRGPNNLGPPKEPPTSCNLQIHPYTSNCVRRIASRRIGRPFDLLRGRR